MGNLYVLKDAVDKIVKRTREPGERYLRVVLTLPVLPYEQYCFLVKLPRQLRDVTLSHTMCVHV